MCKVQTDKRRLNVSKDIIVTRAVRPGFYFIMLHDSPTVDSCLQKTLHLESFL